MPIVHVLMWPGRDAAQKRELIQRMTSVFVEMGIPAKAVSVLVHEVPRDGWGEGGVPATEWKV